MKDDMTAQEQEIWSAIQYLDPDDSHKQVDGAVGVILLALAVLICVVLVELRLRGL